LHRAVEGGDLHRGAEGGLREADGQLAIDVAIVADEDGMVLDLEHHVEVAGDAAPRSGLALPLELEPRPGVHARRDLHGDAGLARDLAGARAVRALVHDDLPLALAGGAGAGDGEEALGEALRPAAPADAADLGARAGLGPRAFAGVAADGTGELQVELGPEGRLFEGDGPIDPEVGAPVARGAAARPAPEDLAEDVAEDVAEAREALEIEAAEALAEGIGLVAEAVVLRPLFGIREAGVGLGRLLELL